MMPPPRTARQALGWRLGAIVRRRSDRPHARICPAPPVLLDAVEAWWAQHPLRTASHRRRPKRRASSRRRSPNAIRSTLMLGAVVVGALLALTKPWRWSAASRAVRGPAAGARRRLLRQSRSNCRLGCSFGSAASTAWCTATAPTRRAATRAALRRTTESPTPPRSAPATTPTAAARCSPDQLPPNGPLPSPPSARDTRSVSLRGVFKNALRRVFFCRAACSLARHRGRVLQPAARRSDGAADAAP